MAARAIWSGQIRLALVSIPVELYPATKSGASISFHQVHEPSGKRIRYEKIVPGIGPVDRDEIMKGYEVSRDRYVLLDPEEIEKVKLESKKTLDLVQFVDLGDIDAMYYEKPYYVVPADDLAADAFVVLRDALRRTKKIGIGQLAMRGQEYVVALKPCGKGLLLETLRYADEVHKANSYFSEIEDKEPDEDMVDLAQTLIEKKTGEFDASEFRNRYVDALRELIEEKQRKKGEKVIQDPDADKPLARGGNVVDLMAALKKSLETSGSKPGKSKGKAKAEPRAKDSGVKKTAAGGRK
ncbi:MAG TPA: Ku protein [Sphingomicrobium sp.]|nr:Ku protein [Sphingomicrobium sp.]